MSYCTTAVSYRSKFAVFYLQPILAAICKFLNDRKFREHCKKHLDEVVPCNKCNKKFRTKFLLGNHTRDYHGEELNCDCCGKHFAAKKSLNVHKATVNNSKQSKRVNTQQCHVCNVNLKSSATLKEHIKTHTSKETLKCDECGKSYSTNGSLLKHVKGAHESDNTCLSVCLSTAHIILFLKYGHIPTLFCSQIQISHL